MGFNILKHGNDGGGADVDGGSTNRASFPLSNFEEMGKNHAHISFFAYFVGLPIGVIAARYLRTFTGGWLLPHMLINGLFVAPLVIAGFILGYQTTSMSELPHFTDPHQKMGLAIFILYWIQLFLGIFIHWIKVPRVFQGPLGRRPQNYLHITIGITIVILASWQTHYGLYTEWAFATGNLHPVSSGCKHFWLAILVIVWSVYGIGLLLLPRQIKQERARMQPKVIDSKERPPSA